jgi:uncharacterized membrane protein YkvI
MQEKKWGFTALKDIMDGGFACGQDAVQFYAPDMTFISNFCLSSNELFVPFSLRSH